MAMVEQPTPETNGNESPRVNADGWRCSTRLVFQETFPLLVRKFTFIILLVAVFALAFAVRCWNLRDVFIEDRIYFVDPDCYSRMTRAASIAEGGPLVIRHHDFENWPDGITPHTTAPLDWLIVGLKRISDFGFRISDLGNASVLRGQTLDLAGALVSPLLGALTCAWLAAWALSAARHSSLIARHAAFAAPLFFAISPIAVHGGVLGRPDHQSLVVLLLAIIIGAEVRLMQTVREWEKHARPPNRHIAKWSIIAGVAGGLAMWVSLYEPLILFGVIFVLIALLDREQFRWRERWLGWTIAAAIYAASLLIDGWRIALPDASVRAYFQNWSHSIGELAHLDLAGSLLWRWCGWAVALAPITLSIAVWMKMKAARATAGAHPAYRPAAFLLGLLLVTFALTCWQLRWGYFFALVFAMSLPWQLAVARRAWIAWTAFLVSLVPIAQDWDARIFPDDEALQRRDMARLERTALRQTVSVMHDGAFLAPWWQSPAIAYWTRLPGVAGSSHQSLPGIVDTARFFLTDTPEEAAAILKKRRIAWVLTDDAERMTGTSASLLGIDSPATPLGLILAENPHNAPPFLRETATPPASGNRVFFHLYAVDPGALRQ